MQEEKIIQENLFAVNNESDKHISQKVISEDLSTEELKRIKKKTEAQRNFS